MRSALQTMLAYQAAGNHLKLALLYLFHFGLIIWSRVGVMIVITRQGDLMYRRSNGKAIWHSNAGCSLWPLLNFDEKEAPDDGIVCEQCAEIECMVRHHRVGGLPKSDSSQAGENRAK